MYTSSIEPDGKIIIGGGFTSFNGTARNYITRLNADGSLDATFNLGTGIGGFPYPSVSTIALQPDGKIIVGGEFTSFNGTTRNRIARLNADGSLDATFNPEVGEDRVLTIAVQADGKIIIGGQFTYINNISRNRIARLNGDGSLDATFNPGTGASGSVSTVALQANGKIIIGGNFTSYNGSNRSCIARLNADGSLDATFNLGTGANSTVWTTAMQADGKIMIGGNFTAYNGTSRRYIAGLYANGNLDADFNPITGANGRIYSTALQSDGKTIISGDFTYYNSNSRNNISRLNANGSLDTTFNLGLGSNNTVQTTALQTDGKIIIGGWFTSYHGTTRNRIARLNADGSLDATFNPGTGASSAVRTIALQPDGKIIIGGAFISINGASRNRIARLNTDGSLDSTFNPGIGANDLVRSINLLPNGKMIIGGDFTSYNGTSRNRIARLNDDGNIDSTFNPGTGANNYVFTTILQNDGKIILGGYFTSYNGFPRNYIARLNTDGSLDATFNPGTGANNYVNTIAVQADGKIIIGGIFTTFNGITKNRIACLNADGTLETAFNLGIGVNSVVHSTLIQPDGKIIIGGEFINYNNSLTPRIVRLYGSDCPIIPIPTISGNTNLCQSSTTSLTSSSLTGNLWSTGDTTRTITVNQAGTYTVRSMINGCTSAISNPITVSVIAPPAPQIAFDSVGNRCLGSEIIVSVAGNHNQFRWNTGATTRSINVRRTGEYSAEVLDSSGCWSLPSRPARIIFDTAFCIIRISIIGLDSLEASIYADRYEWFLDGIQLLTGNNDKVIPIQGNGVYTVRAIIDGRTSPLSNPIVITSGKKSIKAPKLKLYPNPTTGLVTLTTDADAESISITNSVGQLVFTTKAQPEMELNLNHLAKGVYMVQVQSIKGVSNQRLVIQ